MEALLPNAVFGPSKFPGIPELKNFDRVFDYIKPLGEGGHGEVHLVENRNRQPFALKIVQGGDQEYLLEVQGSEIIKTCCNDDPSLMKYYGAFVIPSGQLTGNALLYEYLNGTTLDKYAKVAKPEDIKIIIRWLIETIQGLDAQGVSYQDLVDGNIMIMPNRDLKLLDYGLLYKTTNPFYSPAFQKLGVTEVIRGLLLNGPYAQDPEFQPLLRLVDDYYDDYIRVSSNIYDAIAGIPEADREMAINNYYNRRIHIDYDRLLAMLD